MKFWRTAQEWFKFAPCFGVRDFTVPPARDDGGPTSDADYVRSVCDSCRVRPECAKAACNEQWNDVWVCGVWIPGHDVDRREAIALRQNLFDSIEQELRDRGDDV